MTKALENIKSITAVGGGNLTEAAQEQTVGVISYLVTNQDATEIDETQLNLCLDVL